MVVVVKVMDAWLICLIDGLIGWLIGASIVSLAAFCSGKLVGLCSGCLEKLSRPVQVSDICGGPAQQDAHAGWRVASSPKGMARTPKHMGGSVFVGWYPGAGLVKKGNQREATIYLFFAGEATK